MAISSLTCPPPVRRAARTTSLDYTLLHSAVDRYVHGDYGPALAETFAHLFPDHEVPDLESHDFSFVQGSSRVSVRASDGMLTVSVPLVRLTEETITTAALRFVLTNISAAGQLYQPCLRGDEIYLEYTDRLTRLHPYKIREVLRRMPVEADKNDDWMVAEFRCAPLGREPIESLSTEELERAEHIWRTHWDEVDELVKESQRMRSLFFLNEITAYAIHHVGYALPLSGYWWSRISASGDTFNDTNVDPQTREASLSRCVKEMKAVTRESLQESLGHAHYAISPHAEGTEKILSANLGPEEYLDSIVRMHNGGRYMEAAVGLIGTYNYLLARFSWPLEIEEMMVAGLAEATEKPWRAAASALLEHASTLMDAASESEEVPESLEEDDETEDDETEDDDSEDDEVTT